MMERSQPTALDGGWGYVIIVSSFFVAFMLDGLENSYGLLLPSVLATYDASYFVATLCGGMITGVCLGMGPLTAILVRKFGCRPVAFTGGIVTCISMVMATRAEAIEVFVICYGVFTGIGIGLIYLPSITMINMYFNKKRGVVVGIVTSGSGVGLLVMAKVIGSLMGEYGWRGCYLIIGGIYLHLCACACLMRPLEDNFRYGDASEENAEETGESLIPQSENGTLKTDHAVDVTLYSVKPTHDPLNPHFVHLVDASSIPNGNPSILCDTKEDKKNETCPQIRGDSHACHQGDSLNHQISHDSLSGQKPVTLHEHEEGHTEDIHCEGKTPLQKVVDGDNTVVVPASTTSAVSTSFGSGNSFVGSGVLQDLKYDALNHNLQQHPYHHRSHHHHQSPSHHGSHFTMSERGDVDYIAVFDLPNDKRAYLNLPPECISISTLSINTLRSRSLHSIRSKSVHSVRSKSLHSVKAYSHLTLKSASKTSLEEQLEVEIQTVSYNPFSLFKIIRFDLFCIGAFLIQIAASIPSMFTPSYALSLGLDISTATNIVSILGISNTIGRLIAGVLANLGLGAVRVYNSGTFLAGVACYLLPFCTSYETLVAFAVCHGFFIGFFPPLQSVILVEQLGLDRLPASFGIMCLCKSVASMVGPSFAGALYEMVGNYSVPYYFTGGILTLSMILHCIMSICPKVQD